jgi:hypothetical protein
MPHPIGSAQPTTLAGHRPYNSHASVAAGCMSDCPATQHGEVKGQPSFAHAHALISHDCNRHSTFGTGMHTQWKHTGCQTAQFLTDLLHHAKHTTPACKTYHTSMPINPRLHTAADGGLVKTYCMPQAAASAAQATKHTDKDATQRNQHSHPHSCCSWHCMRHALIQLLPPPPAAAAAWLGWDCQHITPLLAAQPLAGLILGAC